MDRSDVITLIKTTYTRDQYGIDQPAETGREIFCQVDSVTRAEFYDAGRNGLNPEFKFTVFGPDYDGEEVIQYNGLRYAVVRTYRTRSDSMELYAERKGGTNGGY